MNKVIFILLAIFCFAGIAESRELQVLKKKTYNIELPILVVPANSTISEVYEIGTITKRLPDQILGTIQTGDWVTSLPCTMGVETVDGLSAIEESWGISYAKKESGYIRFYRFMENKSDEEMNSYAWNLKVKTAWIKY